MTNSPLRRVGLFDDHLPNLLAPALPSQSFTLRERDIIQGLCNDLTAKMIADALGISVFTVQVHIKKIKRKLKVHTSGGIVARAFRSGIVQ